MPKNKQEQARPIKYIFDKYIFCNGFDARISIKLVAIITIMMRLKKMKKSTHAHDTKSHGVVVIVDVVVLLLLRPPRFLFHHLISFTLPVVFFFLFLSLPLWKCVYMFGWFKFGWMRHCRSYFRYMHMQTHTYQIVHIVCDYTIWRHTIKSSNSSCQSDTHRHTHTIYI